MWQCPHCGVPQAETARCWVCRRSSTTCSTCRHFRASLAAEVGYCGLDRYRRPLTGLEQRPCWEEGDAKPEDAPVHAGTGIGMQADRKSARRRAGTPYIPGDMDRSPARHFVPIEDVGRAPLEDVARVPSPMSGRSSLAPGGVMPSGASPAAAGSTARATAWADQAEGWEGRTSLFADLES